MMMNDTTLNGIMESIEEIEPFMEGIVEGTMHRLFDQYIQKNEAYGNNAHNTFVQFGDVAYAIRIQDKARRFETLNANQNIDHGDESIKDTLGDAVTYCCMASGDIVTSDRNTDGDSNFTETLDTMYRLGQNKEQDIEGMAKVFQDTYMKDCSLTDAVYHMYADGSFTPAALILLASYFLNELIKRSDRS